MSELKATEYLESLIKPLLGSPDALRIDETSDERGVFLVLEVDPSDMGRVIGKNGETAKAFRRLTRQYGMSRDEQKISIRIKDPQNDVNSDDEEVELQD